MLIVSLSVLAVLIQLSDSYLRYLSFRDGMTNDEKKLLGQRFAVYAVLCSTIYGAAFACFGTTASVYKALLILGWSPWVAIFMTTVKRNVWQHIFIFGMSEVWALVQHNWSAIIDVLLWNGGKPENFILIHAVLYPILFVVFLPIERRYFGKLLPPEKFFKDYGKITALFPLIMSFGVIVLWSQEPMIHSWQERFSRFYLPFAFFFFYRHISVTTKQLQEQKLTDQNLQRMKEQLTTLGEYNRLIQENHEKVAVMRHDLRHNYRLIYMMLQNGKIADVKKHIETQEKLLGKTVVKNFCDPPLINAVLLVCLSRAEKIGIKVSHKINLPMNLGVDESDCALLVSNLLENAINTAKLQPPNSRRISIVMQNVGRQFVLEVANRCETLVDFDEKNYPRTSREGHGLGMASVKIFADKYDAYTDFSQEDGIFKVTMYWQNSG